MDMDTVLHNLGVRDDTLSENEMSHLDEKGFLTLPNIMSANQVAIVIQCLSVMHPSLSTLRTVEEMDVRSRNSVSLHIISKERPFVFKLKL